MNNDLIGRDVYFYNWEKWWAGSIVDVQYDNNIPVFTDIDPKSYCMNFDLKLDVEEKLLLSHSFLQLILVILDEFFYNIRKNNP